MYRAVGMLGAGRLSSGSACQALSFCKTCDLIKLSKLIQRKKSDLLRDCDVINFVRDGRGNLYWRDLLCAVKFFTRRGKRIVMCERRLLRAVDYSDPTECKDDTIMI